MEWVDQYLGSDFCTSLTAFTSSHSLHLKCFSSHLYKTAFLNLKGHIQMLSASRCFLDFSCKLSRTPINFQSTAVFHLQHLTFNFIPWVLAQIHFSPFCKYCLCQTYYRDMRETEVGAHCPLAHKFLISQMRADSVVTQHQSITTEVETKSRQDQN